MNTTTNIKRFLVCTIFIANLVCSTIVLAKKPNNPKKIETTKKDKKPKKEIAKKSEKKTKNKSDVAKHQKPTIAHKKQKNIPKVTEEEVVEKKAIEPAVIAQVPKEIAQKETPKESSKEKTPAKQPIYADGSKTIVEKKVVSVKNETATLVVTKNAISPAKTTNTIVVAKVVKGADSSRIIKRQNPSALFRKIEESNIISVSGFKVNKVSYGSFADYIADYVKNYHANFGDRMGRIRNNNKGYFSLIENTLRKYGLPKEIRSLAIIESGLNPNAVSPVGAVGPWQFMEGTATMYGLKVSETLDERRDIRKSTEAAAKFCKRLHGIFHDWLLVIAAYNYGPGAILRKLQGSKGNSFWDIKKSLPKETQNHVMAWIATSAYYDKNTKVLDLGNKPYDALKLSSKDLGTALAKKKIKIEKKEEAEDVNIEEEKEEIGPQIKPEELGEIITLKIKGAYNVEAVSTILDYDLNKLRRWNPTFNEECKANITHVKLIIPSAKLDAFILLKDKILAESIKNPHTTSTPTQKIANAIKLPKPLKDTTKNKNATVKTTVKNAKDSTFANNKLVKPDAVKKIYLVKKGDNIVEIAEEFGLTVDRLKQINKLTSTKLTVGRKLFLE